MMRTITFSVVKIFDWKIHELRPNTCIYPRVERFEYITIDFDSDKDDPFCDAVLELDKKMGDKNYFIVYWWWNDSNHEFMFNEGK